MRLDVDGLRIPLKIRINPRARRMSLRLDNKDDVAVLVLPHAGLQAQGLQFVDEKQRWLKRQWTARPARIPFSHGQQIPFLDSLLTLQHQPESRAGVQRLGDRLLVSGDARHMARRTTDWLKRQARTALLEATQKHCRRLDLQMAGIVIRDPKTRWGSCSAAGMLSFSWRLVLTPPEILDYVAAHEVCHLRIRNHGPQFWALLATVHEDPKTADAWINHHGTRLHRYG